jgi:hypothetical protein
MDIPLHYWPQEEQRFAELPHEGNWGSSHIGVETLAIEGHSFLGNQDST